MKVAVIGAGGHVGFPFSCVIANAGHTVYGIDVNQYAVDMLNKGHVPYDCYQMSSRFIEGAILMYLRRKGQVAKNKPLEGREEYEQRLDENEEGFEGAYVKDPIPGRYDYVYDLEEL